MNKLKDLCNHPYFYWAYFLLKNPSENIPFFIHDLKQDYLSLSGQVNYPSNFVLICGLPKSGTTWVEQIFSQVPGFVQMNKSPFRHIKGYDDLNHPHDVNQKILTSYPKKRFSYLKTHTPCSPENIKQIKTAKIRPIVTVRDIRDMMISRYNHILNMPTHNLHFIIKDMDEKEGFTRSLYPADETDNNPLEYFSDWIRGWKDYESKFPDKACLISYEGMKDNLAENLLKIFNFLDFNLSEKSVENIIQKQKQKYDAFNNTDLNKNLARSKNTISTFRKGKIGEWKELFTDEHHRIFQEVAGDLLSDHN